MADAAKIEVAVTYSENADYTSPNWVSKLDAQELTPSEVVPFARVSVPLSTDSPATFTLDVANYNDGSLIIKNNNTTTTEYVVVTYTNLNGTAISDLRVYGGSFAVIPDIDCSAANPTFQSVTGNSVCDIGLVPHS